MKRNLLYLSTSTALLLPNMAGAEITCSEADCTALGYSTTVDPSCQTILKCPFDTNYQLCVCINPCDGYNITPERAEAQNIFDRYNVESCVNCTGITMYKVISYKDICTAKGHEYDESPQGYTCSQETVTDEYSGQQTTCYNSCEYCDFRGYELSTCPSYGICTSYYCGGIRKYQLTKCASGYIMQGNSCIDRDDLSSSSSSESTDTGPGGYIEACFIDCMQKPNATTSDCYSNCSR